MGRGCQSPYYYSYEPRRRKGVRAKTSGVNKTTKADAYIAMVCEGSGSRRFKDWLKSKPIERFVEPINKC